MGLELELDRETSLREPVESLDRAGLTDGVCTTEQQGRPAEDRIGHVLPGRSAHSGVHRQQLVALGAIETVCESRLDVPDGVALVCFDDVEYASRLYPLPTVVEQPAEPFGVGGDRGDRGRRDAKRFSRPGGTGSS